MIYSIQNDYLQVKVESLGAELQSIKSLKTGTEYLWQGNPEVWKSRSPILFPMCGRIFGGKYTYQGKEYFMNTHGFARTSDFMLKNKRDDEISLYITSNAKTLECYPFEFNFVITLKLQKSKLLVKFDIENLGEEVMPFSIGGHPGFNAPFIEGESISDYYVEFSPAGKYVTAKFTEDGFDSGETFALDLIDDKIFPIKDDIFIANDSAFMPNPPTSLTLKSNKNGRFVKVSASDMTYFGLWKATKPNSNFICLEPWLGFAPKENEIADLSTKAHLIHLDGKKTFNTGYEIEIGE